MFRQYLVVQDPSVGLGSAITNSLLDIASGGPHRAFSAAVAYVNVAGVESFLSVIERVISDWSSIPKRWLVSCDFGTTEPAALELLSEVANSEVKIHAGEFVLSRHLRPRSCFHPKLYCFEGRAQNSLGVLAGSANLTLGGLALGVEVAVAVIWTPPVTRGERDALVAFRKQLQWLDLAWSQATPCTASFVLRYQRLRVRPNATEDDASLVRKAASVARSLATPKIDIARWATARAFWIEVRKLYKNRGPRKPGNQLDLPRGARVFFGFAAGDVPPNTIFGSVNLFFGRSRMVERTVKFGDNHMDKINLPIPGEEGPVTYDRSVLVFERTAPNTFHVYQATSRQASRLRRESSQLGLAFKMSSKRIYGFV